jgi:hypothetical protein
MVITNGDASNGDASGTIGAMITHGLTMDHDRLHRHSRQWVAISTLVTNGSPSSTMVDIVTTGFR